MISSQKTEDILMRLNQNIPITLKVSQKNASLFLKPQDDEVVSLLTDTSENIYVKIDGLYKVPVPISEFDYYDGFYEITPMITSQTLYTKDKMMRDNLLINTIPTEEKINSAGGYTFIIGG